MEAPKLPRLSVIRIVGFFAVAFFAFSFGAQHARAQLSTPTPVVIGSQYGKVTTLGQEGQAAWETDNAGRRRVAYLEPEADFHVFVVAYVNDQKCDATGNLCDLEFRMTCADGAGIACNDAAVEWTNALSGAAPQVWKTNPDFTLYPSPNGKDLWVSYKVNEAPCNIDLPHTLNTVNIKKLPWDSATKLFNASAVPEKTVGTSALDGTTKCETDTGTTPISYSSEVGVAVQIHDGGQERVWALQSQAEYSGTPLRPVRYYNVVSTDVFTDTVPTWTPRLSSLGRVDALKNTSITTVFPSLAKVLFFPIGTAGTPAIMRVTPKFVVRNTTDGACNTTLNPGVGLGFISLKANDGAAGTEWWVNSGSTPKQLTPEFYPYQWNIQGGTCAGIAETGTSAWPMDFSVASSPIDASSSSVVVAMTGGRDAAGTHFQDSIRLKNCRASYSGTTSAIDCADDNDDLGNVGYKKIFDSISGVTQAFSSASVGFIGDTAYVAARNTQTGKLVIFGESAAHRYTAPTGPEDSNSTWAWTKILPQNPTSPALNQSGDTRTASMVRYVPATAFPLHSTLPAVTWSMVGSQRVSFTSLIGGSNIGAGVAAPAKGFGWSSNFGSLSLNCSGFPGEPVCASPYGVGIGVAASTTRPVATVLSPTSATTYALGGYAWSPNAGFVSFERQDSVCTGGSPACTQTNATGNPPGTAYHNCTTVAGTLRCTSLSQVPIAKYDSSTQHLWGWGRFLNLCNWDATNKRCLRSDGGWLRLRGYWYKKTGSTPAVSSTFAASVSSDTTSLPIDTFRLSASPFTLDIFPLADASAFPSSGVVLIGTEYFTYSGKSGNSLTGILPGYSMYNGGTIAAGTTVIAVSGVGGATDVNIGGPYGVDAYWTDDHYEFSGWGWSEEYGWVHFNPLIFIGYAWMETLFGNTYVSGGDVALPAPRSSYNAPIMKCDNDNDGAFDDQCAVSMYRIEASGSITGLTFAGTGQAIDPADSVDPTVSGLIRCPGGDCSADPTDLLTRGGQTAVAFPTVGSTSSTYRNALGKLDVGGLTRFLNASVSENTVVGSKVIKKDKNRYGNDVYETKAGVAWTTSELRGLVAGADWPNPALETFQSQVVHVKGDLTVDGASATFQNLVAGTLTVTGVTGGTFATPNTGVLLPQRADCTGCSVVIDQGTDKEDYFAYASYNGSNQFTGVTWIRGACGGVACSHTTSSSVRSVWRLPHVAAHCVQNPATSCTQDSTCSAITPGDICTTKAQAVTIVVDGDLEIQYNILGTTFESDADLTGVTPLKMQDVPTIAFIVKGNASIDPSVNRVTGAFVVIGTDTSQDPSISGGILATGNDAGSCNTSTGQCNPLVAQGLFFARQFTLQRTGNTKKNESAAESFRFDERLFLNPPPGLEDVTKALANPERQLP